MIECKKCGKHNPDGLDICECGELLLQSNTENKSSGSNNTCHNCNAEIDEGDNYCESCGADLKQENQESMPQYKIFNRDNTFTQEIPFNSELLFGRDKENVDVSLAGLEGSEFISRKHFKISYNSRGLQIEDVGSTNSTKLNGNTLKSHEPCPIPDKSEITVAGEITLFFESI